VLVGFAAIFFTTFGTLIILIGAVLYALMTHFDPIRVNTLFLLLVLYLAGEAAEYIFVIVGAKRFGASNLAAVGALVGGIIGAILGGILLGIGLILGAFLGIFLGALAMELCCKKDLTASIKAGVGGVLGRIGSIVVKVLLALVMIGIIVERLITGSFITR